ncbi:MAG TPA: hypothetical protein VLI04_01115 [Nocardioidaceae bacterium]|nr:hypothetical protein [Nocardioidaceae bacterium]
MPGSSTPAGAARAPYLRVPLTLAALLIAGTTTACTGGDEKATDDPTPTVSTVPEASLELGRVRVRGDLTPKAKTRVTEGVSAALQEYLDSALLGDYPRSDFSLGGFTRGAVTAAKRDLDLLTGTAFSDAESVTATTLTAELAVLAPDGRPAGATAKVRFALDVDGVPVVVRGRLVLTPNEGTWRIFGYDVSSNATDAATAEGES